MEPWAKFRAWFREKCGGWYVAEIKAAAHNEVTSHTYEAA